MSISLRAIAAAATLCLSAAAAHADVTLFSEDFQSGLGQWNAGSGTLVDDPADPFSGNKVLHFTNLGSGGDAFTVASFFAPSQKYTISFDYLSAGRKGKPTNDLGGFVGIGDGTPGNHTWIAGTQAGYPGLEVQLTHNGTWTNYAITIDASTFNFVHGSGSLAGKPFYLFLEDWSGSNDGVAGNVYFDNITVTAAVPEPGTFALAGLGVAALLLRRRRPA